MPKNEFCIKQLVCFSRMRTRQIFCLFCESISIFFSFFFAFLLYYQFFAHFIVFFCMDLWLPNFLGKGQNFRITANPYAPLMHRSTWSDNNQSGRRRFKAIHIIMLEEHA